MTLKKPVKKNEEIEQIEQDTETLDFNNPSFKFVPPGYHRYRQQGGYLVCQSCEVKHAVWIGMDKIMVGEDKKGKPILKNRMSVSGSGIGQVPEPVTGN